MRYLNDKQIGVNDTEAEPAHLAQLLILIDKNEVSNQAAKQVFASVLETGELPSKIITDQGLAQVNDTGKIEDLVKEVIVENPKAADDFKNGKESSIDFLFGQIMRKTKGSANPNVVRELLKSKLTEG